MRNKTYLLLLLALMLSGCVRDKDEPVAEYVQVGDLLPAFTAKGEGANSYNSADAAGKVTLLCFFTTWCPNCHRELPKIQYVWEERSTDYPDFELVAIGREEVLGAIKTFWEENGYTMPYYEDPGREIYKQFASATVPRMYIIDRSRKIVEVMAGETELTKEGWLAKIKSYLENE